MASCMMALCAWRIGRKASPWVSHISVDPTMSVKRKVMVPAGGCKVLAFTGMPWGFRARVRSPGRLPQRAREFQEELTADACANRDYPTDARNAGFQPVLKGAGRRGLAVWTRPRGEL